MVRLVHYEDVEPYITKDGSVIRELMHPSVHGNRGASVAEAIVEPGRSTRLHRHLTSEEIYHITQGKGVMRLGGERFEVKTGDTVLIEPGVEHMIENRSEIPLRILCISYPAYSHQDTQLL